MPARRRAQAAVSALVALGLLLVPLLAFASAAAAAATVTLADLEAQTVASGQALRAKVSQVTDTILATEAVQDVVESVTLVYSKRTATDLLAALHANISTFLLDKVATVRTLRDAVVSVFNHTLAADDCVNAYLASYFRTVPAESGLELVDDPAFANLAINMNTSIYTYPGDQVDDLTDLLFNDICRTHALDATFAANMRADPTLRWQYFGSVHGMYRVFPGQSFPYPNYDPRKRPWYVLAAAGPKNIVVVADMSSSMVGSHVTTLVEGVQGLFQTLTPDDFVTLVLFNDDAFVSPCFGPTLVRATTANKQALMSFLTSTNATGLTNWEAAFRLAFQVLSTSIANNISSGCDSLILFITDGNPSAGMYFVEDLVNELNAGIGARVIPYAIGSNLLSFDLWRLACMTDGLFNSVSDGDRLSTRLTHYFELLSAGLSTSDTVIWSSPYFDASGLGLLVTAAMPVFDASSLLAGVPRFLGVVATDVTMPELFSFVREVWESTFSYPFIVSRDGLTLAHPSQNSRTPDDFHQIDLLENFVGPAASAIRNAILSGATGEQRIEDTRRVPSGNGTTAGDSLFTINATYAYQPIADTPYRLVYSLADADVLARIPTVTSLPSDAPLNFFAAFDSYPFFWFTELDLVRQPVSDPRYPLEVISPQHSTVHISPSGFSNVLAEDEAPLSEEATLDLLNYLNNMTSSNVLHLRDAALNDVRLTSLLEPFFKLHVNDLSVAFQYYTTAGGVMRIYPGYDISDLTLEATDDPSFLRAVAHPNSTVMSTPLVRRTDRGTQSKLITLSRAIFAGPPQLDAPNAISQQQQVLPPNATLLGVSRVDFVYDAFVKNLSIAAGLPCLVGGNESSACFLLDSSGLIAAHPAFSTVFTSDHLTDQTLGSMYPSLAADLIAQGVLTPSSAIDFELGLVCTTFTMHLPQNWSALTGSFGTPGCDSGMFSMVALPRTNLIFVQLANYWMNTSVLAKCPQAGNVSCVPYVADICVAPTPLVFRPACSDASVVTPLVLNAIRSSANCVCTIQPDQAGGFVFLLLLPLLLGLGAWVYLRKIKPRCRRRTLSEKVEKRASLTDEIKVPLSPGERNDLATLYVSDVFESRLFRPHRFGRRLRSVHRVQSSKLYDLIMNVLVFCLCFLTIWEPTPVFVDNASVINSYSPTPQVLAAILSVEFVLVAVFLVDACLSMRYEGVKLYFHRPLHVAHFLIVVLLMLDVIIALCAPYLPNPTAEQVIAGGLYHRWRILRLLRPFLLVMFNSNMRRMVMSIVLAFPSILPVLTVLLFIIIVFALIGTEAFRNIYRSSGGLDPNGNFDSFGSTVLSLYVLISAENYPDVMLPAYRDNPGNAVYFVVFYLTASVLVVSSLVAVISSAYTDYFTRLSERLRIRKFQGLTAAFVLFDSNRDGTIPVESFFSVTHHSTLFSTCCHRSRSAAFAEVKAVTLFKTDPAGTAACGGGDLAVAMDALATGQVSTRDLPMAPVASRSPSTLEPQKDGSPSAGTPSMGPSAPPAHLQRVLRSHSFASTASGTSSPLLSILDDAVDDGFFDGVPISELNVNDALLSRKREQLTLYEFIELCLAFEESDISMDEARLIDASFCRRFPSHTPSNTRRLCFRVVQHQVFNLTSLALTFISMVVQCIRASNALSFAFLNLLRWTDVTLLLLYLAEIVIRLIGRGPRGFWEIKWNRFDVLVVTLSILGVIPEIFPIESENLGSVLFVFTFLKALRIFRMISRINAFKLFVTVMAAIARPMLQLLMILFLLMYVYALIGMQLFAGLLDRLSRDVFVDVYTCNFTSFGHALLCLFQPLTGDKWHTAMYAGMRAVHPSYSIYFVSYHFLVAIMILNVVIAVLIDRYTHVESALKAKAASSAGGDDDRRKTIATRVAELRASVRLSSEDRENIKELAKVYYRGRHIPLGALHRTASQLRARARSDTTLRLSLLADETDEREAALRSFRERL